MKTGKFSYKIQGVRAPGEGEVVCTAAKYKAARGPARNGPGVSRTTAVGRSTTQENFTIMQFFKASKGESVRVAVLNRTAKLNDWTIFDFNV